MFVGHASMLGHWENQANIQYVVCTDGGTPLKMIKSINSQKHLTDTYAYIKTAYAYIKTIAV